LSIVSRPRVSARIALAGAVALAVTLHVPSHAQAASLIQLSLDPYTNPQSMHATQVEPDNYAFGSTIVAAVQTGRIANGGASNISWATSTDGGSTWHHGYLPGTTVYASPPGTLSAVSDPSVSYDAAHHTWIIASLPLPAGSTGPGVIASRSTDGGLTWSLPIIVNNQAGTDKSWIVCDNTAASPFYGHCYVEWDNNSQGNVIYMSTSTDGGQTWGPAHTTANRATGIGGQPLVRPDGTVVVPIDDASGASSINVFRSLDGGASWTATTAIARIFSHADAGNLRSGPLPSAEIDSAGTIYLTWEDCRFETNCSANDIVIKGSADGVTWSQARRIPIDAIGSGVDHFLPGLAVDHATSGGSAHLGLVYYYYPQSNCTVSTCRLNVGYVSSTNGGATWSAPIRLAGPMALPWLPLTTQGYMVGDYMSAAVDNGVVYPVFSVAHAKNGSTFDEALYTASGLAISGGTLSGNGDQPVPSATSDRQLPGGAATAH
jgi:hypothetical protein